MAGIKRRVLMVDDNPDTVLLLGKIGEILGHHVATATNGPQAMQVAAAFVPEVAVIDLTMPMMGGQELARKLRLAHAETGLKLIAFPAGRRSGIHRVPAQARLDRAIGSPAALGCAQNLTRPRRERILRSSHLPSSTARRLAGAHSFPARL